MCGICGSYGYTSGAPADAGVLHAMLAAIAHRGPDDEGALLAGPLALGVRRLSIIDLAGGRQPVASEDGRVVVVFNGEIYNYRELRERLLRRGHRLASCCDTEVIAHLYEELGPACVEELRGMFAFALWDAAQGRLILARDRLGIKPLYYTTAGGTLVFGSEIKTLLQHPAVSARIDLDALGAFVALKYVPAPRTLFAGVAALPPGSILTCDAGGVQVRPYWELRFPPAGRPVDEEQTAAELAALLRETVGLHLQSDVAFGAFLSGGLDSSTVVALMSELLGRPVKTFAVGYTGAGAAYSELPYARLVARHVGAEHHEVLVGADEFVDLAERVVWHLDQPIADEAAVTNYAVAQLAARHVKMVLTGEGGDELFAGYARYSGERLAPLFAALPGPARAAARQFAAHGPLPRRAGLALNALAERDEAARLVAWFPLFNRAQRHKLLAPAVLAALDEDAPERLFAERLARCGARDPLSRMLALDTALWLPDDLLARGDKTSMAASIEARVPLLDHRLAEFAAALPPQLKLHGLTRKYLLRKVAAPLLPPEILARPKRGFPVPIAIWLRGGARAFAHDLLAPATVRRRGLFAPEAVARLLAEHDSGRADHGAQLWALISVELWQRLFLDQPPRPRPPWGRPVTMAPAGEGRRTYAVPGS
jgi:asparagine synthase (glutamine-hydrolysing)